MRRLDSLDRRILENIQSGFPVCERPFKSLADKLGIAEHALIEKVGFLTSQGIIRRFGAVFDSRKLGYVSTLVAVRVPDPQRLPQIAEAVCRYDEVTHNYQRDDPFNLWFTLIASTPRRIEQILSRVSRLPGVAEVHSLPTEEVYKISAEFRVLETGRQGGEYS